MARVFVSVSYQHFSVDFFAYLVVHDGSDGCEWRRIHVPNLDPFKNVATLDQISIPCPLLAIREALVRLEGRHLVTVEEFLPGADLAVDPLLKQLDLEVCNSLSELSCRNRGVDVELWSLFPLSTDQFFSSTDWVVSVVWFSFMKSFFPLQPLPILLDPYFSVNLAVNLRERQVWTLNLGSKISFQVFIKTPDGKSILFWVRASKHIEQLKQNILHSLGIPILLQSLICGGNSMQDYLRLQDYNITPSSTIILNLRL